jgi:hypothetical protein
MFMAIDATDMQRQEGFLTLKAAFDKVRSSCGSVSPSMTTIPASNHFGNLFHLYQNTHQVHTHSQNTRSNKRLIIVGPLAPVVYTFSSSTADTATHSTRFTDTRRSCNLNTSSLLSFQVQLKDHAPFVISKDE